MKRTTLGLLALMMMIGAVGCGPSYNKVEGTVQLDDGTPVEGATVTFVPNEEKGAPATGLTDSAGKFSLRSDGKEGAQRGKYKVLITKTQEFKGSTDPGAQDYIKKAMKEMPKTAGSSKGPWMPPGMAKQAPVNTELGQDYAYADKTPFKDVEVPPSAPLTFKVKKGATKKN